MSTIFWVFTEKPKEEPVEEPEAVPEQQKAPEAKKKTPSPKGLGPEFVEVYQDTVCLVSIYMFYTCTLYSLFVVSVT